MLDFQVNHSLEKPTPKVSCCGQGLGVVPLVVLMDHNHNSSDHRCHALVVPIASGHVMGQAVEAIIRHHGIHTHEVTHGVEHHLQQVAAAHKAFVSDPSQTFRTVNTSKYLSYLLSKDISMDTLCMSFFLHLKQHLWYCA